MTNTTANNSERKAEAPAPKPEPAKDAAVAQPTGAVATAPSKTTEVVSHCPGHKKEVTRETEQIGKYQHERVTTHEVAEKHGKHVHAHAEAHIVEDVLRPAPGAGDKTSTAATTAPKKAEAAAPKPESTKDSKAPQPSAQSATEPKSTQPKETGCSCASKNCEKECAKCSSAGPVAAAPTKTTEVVSHCPGHKKEVTRETEQIGKYQHERVTTHEVAEKHGKHVHAHAEAHIVEDVLRPAPNATAPKEPATGKADEKTEGAQKPSATKA